MAARAFETQEKASKFCIRTKRMEMMLATKLAGGLNPRRHLKKLVIGQVAASTERFDTINPRAAVLERTRQRFRELAVARDQSMRAHGPAGLRKTVASGDL